ncbi:ATP-binding cassette domain-containing protein [Campylobacter sp. 2014D-0216]|uniref:ATP-binding cassette domain-containing protein n=1 Tax=Campylobacter sp. 2014D-0216 TaxID=1813595 RepID=UPI0018A5DF57|nr:ATP-binding cassette domain-containing protein [Campylobacter sp. 2014D-0216]QOR01080.1 ABC transporter ATP-binding protein [Campylobacter sp. 2014D-0216]
MIEVSCLNLSFKDQVLLKDVKLELEDGKALAIMGKSGSGKSLFLKSMIRLFDKRYLLHAEKLYLDDQDVLNLKEKELNVLRSKASLLFQDVYGNFYPLVDIGSYFNIVLKTHTSLSTKEIKEKAFFYFECLGLKNHDLLWHSFIYQLSGGMARRVQIALALLSGAQYLLCDEITSSLDKANEEKIIAILKDLKSQFKNLIFITHDIHLAKELCDEVAIMEDKTLLYQMPVKDFLSNPQGAFAKELFSFFENENAFRS